MLAVGKCDICVKRKILVINEMKQDKISLKLKAQDRKNWVEYCELSLKFWMRFAQLSSIFHGMNES